MRAHTMGDHGSDHNPHHDDQNLIRMKPEGNKHSYFLRAKMPRLMGYQVSTDEDGEFKKPSSLCKHGLAPFLSSAVASSGAGSKSEYFDHHNDQYSSLSEEEDLANCLVMLSNKSYNNALSSDHKDENMKAKEVVVVEKGMFQCKACKKVFNSHQALGGHRASHKKVKGCFASKPDGLNDEDTMDEDTIQEDQEALGLSESDATRPTPTTSSTQKRPKMHECSVCRRVFSSGQALGGHKRCHWLTTSTDNAFIPNFHDFQYDHHNQQLCKKPIFTKPHHDHDHQLDLNLNLPPAPQHENHDDDDDNDDKTTRFEASTRSWANHNQQKIESEVFDNNSEEGCGMKLRKLSDLRDVSLDGGWLQVGMASTTKMR